MKEEIPLSKLVKMSYDEIHATDRCDLFYDWFCSDKSLKNKSKRLMSSVRAIVATKTKLFDPDRTYVFFANNCPVSGGLYDDIRVCDIESGEILFNVCPRNPHCDGLATVSFDCDGEDRWETPLAFGSMNDVRAWFKDQSAFETTPEKTASGRGRFGMCRRRPAA